VLQHTDLLRIEAIEPANRFDSGLGDGWDGLLYETTRARKSRVIVGVIVDFVNFCDDAADNLIDRRARVMPWRAHPPVWYRRESPRFPPRLRLLRDCLATCDRFACRAHPCLSRVLFLLVGGEPAGPLLRRHDSPPWWCCWWRAT
jgi:hypothetical protein